MKDMSADMYRKPYRSHFLVRIHMTQKPLELMRRLVRICVPGGSILDPFAGSGTTLEAARLEGHDATGIEVSPEIAERAVGRLGANLKDMTAYA